MSPVEDMVDKWEDRRMVVAGHRRTADGGRVPSACDEKPCREGWIHADTTVVHMALGRRAQAPFRHFRRSPRKRRSVRDSQRKS